MTKYNARTVIMDGYLFGSQAEAARYGELKLLERAGEIRGLVIHPRYSLTVKDILVGVYEADFGYVVSETETLIVEDVKGEPTPVYRLKKKLVRALYGIEIVEIDAAQYRARTRSKR